MSDAVIETDSNLVQVNTEQVEAVTKPEEVEGEASDTLTDTIVPAQEPDTELMPTLAQDDEEPGSDNDTVTAKETVTVSADVSSPETMPVTTVSPTEAQKSPVIPTWQSRPLS